MPEAANYDVLLVGFRNDLARARTLRFLDGTEDPDRKEQLPRLIYTGLERSIAERVRSELELLGAQITVRNSAAARLPATTAMPAGSAVNPNLTRALSLGAIAVVGIGVLMVVSWGLPSPRPRRAPATATDPQPLPTIGLPEIAVQPAEAADATAHVDPHAARLNNAAIEATQRGDFETAVHNLRRALAMAPGEKSLIRNLQVMLLGWAAQALHADDVDAALDRLQEAAALGDDVEVLYATAAAYLRRGDVDPAADALTRATELAPNDSRVLLALAEVHLKRDERPEALAAMQRARESGAGGADLDRRIEVLGREVDTEWDYVERDSAHFQISFADGEIGGVVPLVLDAFENAYDGVGSKFSEYPSQRTPIVLYSQQDFHSVTQTPDWAGGAYDGRIKLPVRGLEAGDDSLYRVARHEYAHRIVTQLSNGRCPVWLNEGLAVWSEEERPGDRVDWAHEKTASRAPIPLAALDRSFTRLGSADAELAYAQSYLATRLLIERHGIHHVTDFLRAVGRQPFAAAFQAAFGQDLSSFEDRLRYEIGGTG